MRYRQCQQWAIRPIIHSFPLCWLCTGVHVSAMMPFGARPSQGSFTCFAGQSDFVSQLVIRYRNKILRSAGAIRSAAACFAGSFPVACALIAELMIHWSRLYPFLSAPREQFFRSSPPPFPTHLRRRQSDQTRRRKQGNVGARATVEVTAVSACRVFDRFAILSAAG